VTAASKRISMCGSESGSLCSEPFRGFADFGPSCARFFAPTAFGAGPDVPGEIVLMPLADLLVDLSRSFIG
jgi:hypothetical protein